MLGRVGKVGRLGSIGGLEGIPAPDLQLNFDQASIGANAAPDDAIDFSRASQATFTDSDGLVKYAPHNLGLYSEDLSNVNWNVTAVTKSSNTDALPARCSLCSSEDCHFKLFLARYMGTESGNDPRTDLYLRIESVYMD